MKRTIVVGGKERTECKDEIIYFSRLLIIYLGQLKEVSWISSYIRPVYTWYWGQNWVWTPIKVPWCLIEQETLLSLLSTGWLQEPDVEEAAFLILRSKLSLNPH